MQCDRAGLWFAAAADGPGVQPPDWWRAGTGPPAALQHPVQDGAAVAADSLSSVAPPPRSSGRGCQVRSHLWPLNLLDDWQFRHQQMSSHVFLQTRNSSGLQDAGFSWTADSVGLWAVLQDRGTNLNVHLFHFFLYYLSVCLSPVCLTCLSLLLSSFQRCCCGLKSRMRRRVLTWQSSPNTSTTSLSGKHWHHFLLLLTNNSQWMWGSVCWVSRCKSCCCLISCQQLCVSVCLCCLHTINPTNAKQLLYRHTWIHNQITSVFQGSFCHHSSGQTSGQRKTTAEVY